MEKGIAIAKKELGELNLVKCPKCGGIHFRHAGNVLTVRTYIRHDKKEIKDETGGNHDTSAHFVYICIGCGHPWVMVLDDLFDAVEYIDVAKFDAVNEALKQDTGTDPHC